MGVPRRKLKRKARLACRFTTGTIRIEPDGRHVTLPRLGTIRIPSGLHLEGDKPETSGMLRVTETLSNGMGTESGGRGAGRARRKQS